MAKAIKGQEPHVIEDKACQRGIDYFGSYHMEDDKIIYSCNDCKAPLCLENMANDKFSVWLEGYDFGTFMSERDHLLGND